MFDQSQPTNPLNDYSQPALEPKPINPLAEDQGGFSPDMQARGAMPYQSPANLPNLEATEDMFRDTDKVPLASNSAIPPLVGPTDPLTELPDDLEDDEGGNRMLFWIGLLVFIVILIGGGYYAYSKFFAGTLVNTIPFLNVNKETPTDQINENANTVETNENSNINANLNENENTNDNTNTSKKSTLDSDKDGLSDEEEAQFGTDSFEPDSDGDGLYDREEVKVYHSNPLNPDSDNDSYLDGKEVEGGWNPLGPGKLLELNFEDNLIN